MEKYVVKVNGMKCAGCENRVKNVLEELDGVEKVKPSFKKGEVEIKSNKQLDLNEVKDKIENLGFQVI